MAGPIRFGSLGEYCGDDADRPVAVPLPLAPMAALVASDGADLYALREGRRVTVPTEGCVVFDLDGVLADEVLLRDGKHDYLGDRPRPDGRALNHAINPKLRIVILTHRQERHRRDTELWLERNQFVYDELIMRANDSKAESGDEKHAALLALRERGIEPILLIDDERANGYAAQALGIPALLVKR